MESAEQRHFCPACSAVFRTAFARCPIDGNKLEELNGDPLVGTTIDDRYMVEECIGEGGMGRVYRAKHTRMSRSYAIKILFGDHAGDSRMRSRFAREAEAVSRLSHVNVISVVDFGETSGGLLYLVMDLAQGIALSDLMQREAPFAPARTVAIMAQLIKGLAHAHSQGLVHRDFKGENVIIVEGEEQQEVPKIVDFGICMIVDDTKSATMLTSSGIVMGTPAVMAPEQASGDTVDHRTDLFSLGIVSYQMLAGCLPFEGSPLEMARKNLYEPLPSIHARCGVQVAPALEAIVRKLTEKNPDDRYQSAREALADLKSLGMPAPIDDWGAPTPMPGLVYFAQPGTGPLPTGALDSMSASMNTMEVVPSVTGLGVQGKKVLLGGVVLLGIAIAAALVFSDGDGDSGGPRSALATANTPDSTVKIPSAHDKVTVRPGSGDSSKTAGLKHAATKAGRKTKTTETNRSARLKGSRALVTKTAINAPAGRSKSNKASKRANAALLKAKAKAKAKQAKAKQAKAKQAKAQPTKEQTLKLYSSVGAALDKLEKIKGKSATAMLRKDYNDISVSRLLSDVSMQPEYHERLLRLRRNIRAKTKTKTKTSRKRH